LEGRGKRYGKEKLSSSPARKGVEGGELTPVQLWGKEKESWGEVFFHRREEGSLVPHLKKGGKKKKSEEVSML